MADSKDTELGFGMRPRTHRVERFCDACGQVDSDPHAVHCMPDGVIIDRHIDCCAAAGCPESTCTDIEEKSGGKRGGTLVKHLEGGGADHLNYASTAKGK